ncbi:MAG: GtrA family protein [Opitutales bacterium]|jgi:putative flippase GtrA|nr:GtrA family protein [Opitutales bacterium]MDP4642903.1 GtrA family protein [Opitutales bacterium]MDP4693886.1 GtrA family protein [Opitutales bacterium]MDP4776591.1 GtrA family protein [Opitutales bacterium]MDP4882752.1 GtrA family protein [Opitutales bacterium]
MALELKALVTRFGRLGVVAICSFLANVLLTVVLTEGFSLPPQTAFAIVLVCIFSVNFWVTRRWVFSDRVEGSNAWAQFVKCLAVSASFRVLEWFAFYLLLDLWHFHYVVTLVGVLCLSFALKSLIYERYVFR